MKVDACTIMRDASGTSRGFAFLTFEDASAVDVVVGREHVLDGKNVCYCSFYALAISMSPRLILNEQYPEKNTFATRVTSLVVYHQTQPLTLCVDFSPHLVRSWMRQS